MVCLAVLCGYPHARMTLRLKLTDRQARRARALKAAERRLGCVLYLARPRLMLVRPGYGCGF